MPAGSCNKIHKKLQKTLCNICLELTCYSYFGEFGRLARTTSRHLVFETGSGAQVKTAIDNIHKVVWKAKKEGYWVSTRTENREGDKNFIHGAVSFWDEKKCCLVKK